MTPAFSDDDLKRLKEELTQECVYCDHDYRSIVKDIPALLTRLEAAEESLGYHRGLLELMKTELNSETQWSWNEWRKAAGKSAVLSDSESEAGK